MEQRQAEANDYLGQARRKFAKCQELAARTSDSPWDGETERQRLRKLRTMHATEGLLAALLATAAVR